MEGSCMTTATVPEIRVALAIKAYGMEIQLWKEVGQREWGATLRDDTTIRLCLPHHSLSSNAEDGGSVRQSNR